MEGPHDPARDSFQDPAFERFDPSSSGDDDATRSARAPARAARVPGIASAALVAVIAVVFAVVALTGIEDGIGAVPAVAAPAGEASAVVGRLGVTAESVVADGQAWRLVTAPFVHGRLLELLIVMSLIVVFGPALERGVGAARTLAMLALMTVVVEAMHILLVLGPGEPSDLLIGLLGPALALPVMLIVVRPNAPALLDFIPIGVAVVAAVAFGVLGAMLLGSIGAARYEAHLLAVPLAPGAVLAVTAFDRARLRWRIESEAGRHERIALARLRTEQLLKKIARDGIDSLSAEERRFLQKASRIYQQRVSERLLRVERDA